MPLFMDHHKHVERLSAEAVTDKITEVKEGSYHLRSLSK